VELPFFDRNQGERKKAEVLEQQAEQELSSTLLQVQTDISKAYQTYQREKKNIARYKGMTGQSAQILQQVQHRYLAGQTTIVDLLDAERNWYDTRLLFYQAEASYYQSYLQVLFNTCLIGKL